MSELLHCRLVHELLYVAHLLVLHQLLLVVQLASLLPQLLFPHLQVSLLVS